MQNCLAEPFSLAVPVHHQPPDPDSPSARSGQYMAKPVSYTHLDVYKRQTINCSRKLWSSAWRRRVLLVEEDLAFESKETADLYHELQKLPAKYRQVIHLYYYEDLKAEQIGKILNRKPATIRTQLTRARAMLRDFMKEEDDV